MTSGHNYKDLQLF